MRARQIVMGAVGILATLPVEAQEVRVTGQVRPRFEYREPALPATGADDFISMRARLGATVSLPEHVLVLVQLQDVRVWGDDAALGTWQGVTELHQAYIGVGRILDRAIGVRAGRQEMQFGAERLVGNADWVQRGRAFDGVRASIGAAPGATVDVFATRLSDRTAARPANAGFHGLYATIPAADGVAAEAYALYNRVRPGVLRTDQGTVGGRLAAAQPRWLGELEAAYQFGERSDTDVSAWMLRANAGPLLLQGRARLLLSYEHYSGGAPGDTEIRVFDTLFGTPHRFLGYADLFTNIPVHTGGRGVQEVAVRGVLMPEPDVELQASFHVFRAASSAGLSSARFGEEVDLRARYRWRAPLWVTGGASYVWQGPALAEAGRLDRDMTWLYLMLNATF